MRYVIRLDDACPTMDRNKWGRMESILHNNSILPLVGIVPNCKDKKLLIDPYDDTFWEKARKWQRDGWSIALHGYDHCYISCQGGINPVWRKSEFAGIPLEIQKKKIKDGYTILKKQGLEPKYFFAPSHTYDLNTLIALREETSIKIISDTIARKPYVENDFFFIPQLAGRCIQIPIDGIFTFCFHPNMMTESDFKRMEDFIHKHRSFFGDFKDIPLSNTYKTKFDKFLSFLYFMRIRIQSLI